MSDLIVDSTSIEPPYEQVRRQIAERAAQGSLAPGHKLPTVRQLAADLALATNTVARAYRELESDGVIETHGRKGTFIASSRTGDEAAVEAASTYVKVARTQGLSKDEAVLLVTDAWTP